MRPERDKKDVAVLYSGHGDTVDDNHNITPWPTSTVSSESSIDSGHVHDLENSYDRYTKIGVMCLLQSPTRYARCLLLPPSTLKLANHATDAHLDFVAPSSAAHHITTLLPHLRPFVQHG